MKKIHLLVPMSGQGTRFQAAGYKDPKPLISVNGRPMIERLMKNFPLDWDVTFVLANNHKHTGLVEKLQEIRPQARILFIDPHSKGPSIAIEKGLEQLSEDTPILVSYCDYAMVWDSTRFEEFVESSDCDACLISYRGFHAHYLNPQTYAYSRLSGDRVVEVKEKGSFTSDREQEFASCGAYYFKSAKLLKNSLKFQYEQNLSLNREFYTSLTVQALLLSQPSSDVRVFEIPAFFQWGTPQDLANFEYWERSTKAYTRFSVRRGKVSQVLMPMAGLGSRFQSITNTIKPLIPVAGKPMFQAALHSLPEAERTVLVGLDFFKPDLEKLNLPRVSVVSLAETPSGQALSTEAGIKALNLDEEVIVSACDHGIVLSDHVWNDFKLNPDSDAAIFTIKGFIGADRSPNAYAYVVPEQLETAFPLVKRVSVKQPVSSQPSADHVLVGTFWFKSGAILASGIEKLKTLDHRVNGELYLDSIFELLINSGHKVRMIPLEGYICWGDPSSLSEALYWQEVFSGMQIGVRSKFPGVV